MLVRRKFVQKTAQSLIKKLDIKMAPVLVEKVAEQLGAEIKLAPSDDELSGFLLRDDNGLNPIIGVNQDHHDHRRRFTIAHEIGHLLLHKGERLYIDGIKSAVRVKLRDKQSEKGTDAEEVEANLFAATLLMPAGFLKKDLAKLGELTLDNEDKISELADRYNVSVQALTFRLSDLGYLQM